jgi:hypothetical protein
VGEVFLVSFCAESGEQFSDFAAEIGGRSFGGFAQKRFQFAKGLLDRIEIGGRSSRARAVFTAPSTATSLGARRLSMMKISPRVSSAYAREPRGVALALQRAGFFEADPVLGENRRTPLRLPAMRRFPQINPSTSLIRTKLSRTQPRRP